MASTYMNNLGLFLFKDVISLGVAFYLISYFGQKAMNAEKSKLTICVEKAASFDRPLKHQLYPMAKRKRYALHSNGYDTLYVPSILTS